MQRKFLGNLFILQALNWLIKPLWIFWIDRLAQVQLGDVWYGKYYVIFSFGLLFNILLDFGLNSYVATRVGTTGNPSEAKPVLRLRLFSALVYIVLVFLLGIWQDFKPEILALAILNQVLAGFVLFYRSILQGRQWFKTDSIISVTDRLIAIILCGVLLYGNGFVGYNGVVFFLCAQTAGYLVALILSAWLSFKGVKETAVADTKTIELLKSTAWFATLAFAMSVFTRIDALMIKSLSKGGYAEAGLYAQSFRLLDAALIFSSLISTILLPMFASMIAKKENVDGLIWLNLRIMLFVSIPAALSARFFGGDILNLLYSKTYSGEQEFLKSQSVFFPLLTCFIPMSMVHIFGTYITAGNRVRLLSFIAAGAVIINVIMNCTLIPENGALGAAWAGLMTQTLFAASCVVVVIRERAFIPGINRIMLLLIWAGLSILLFHTSSVYVKGITGMLAACSGFVILTIFSGVFFGELKNFFTKKS